MKKLLLTIIIFSSALSIAYSQCTPTVSITTPSTTICGGTSITITANPGNGGTTPTYQWRKGGVEIIGATNATYTTTTAANGDEYSVIMISNAVCASPTTATSNTVAMTVTSVVTPTVSITVTATTICSGTSVTFTASPGNGGVSPSYEWYVNGVSQGPLSPNVTFTSSTLINGDQVSVRMVSNAGCVAAPGTATSTAITMVVNSILVPTVSISANPTSICTNSSTTFTATPTNGGAAPIYQWSINATYIGTPSSSTTFTTTALTSSTDVVRVDLTSNALCASPTTATASMSINVASGITAGTIGSGQTVCYNTIPTAITQISAPTNIVGIPTFIWEVSLDGTAYSPIVGYSGATYIFSSPLTQDLYIRKVITDPGTPAPCNVATSNAVRITVGPQLTAGTIEADETICAGTAASTITETNSPTGGTGTFSYQWESSSTAGGPYANIASATGATYSPGVLTVTTYYRRIETSGTCGSLTSNEIAKTVALTTVPTIHIDDPGQTCDGDIVLFKCQATTVGSDPIYNWYVNNILIASNSPTFTLVNAFEPLKSGDEVWAELITNSTCANTGSVISNKVTVDLVPCTVSNSIYSTSNIDILMQPYVSNSIPNSTGFVYFWSITDGSVSTSINTSMSQAGINIFPNPTTESFNITMPESGLDVSYEILDVTGARVANGLFTSTGSEQKIETNFGAGMYQVVLKYNNVVTCARLSKVK